MLCIYAVSSFFMFQIRHSKRNHGGDKISVFREVSYLQPGRFYRPCEYCHGLEYLCHQVIRYNVPFVCLFYAAVRS
jgi:hypothetical protein